MYQYLQTLGAFLAKAEDHRYRLREKQYNFSMEGDKIPLQEFFFFFGMKEASWVLKAL